MEILRVEDLIQMLKISRPTLYRWLKQDNFPKPIHLGPKTPVWRQSDIEEWISQKN